jgi:hypothetical protein
MLQQALANQPLSLIGLDLAILFQNMRLCRNHKSRWLFEKI